MLRISISPQHIEIHNQSGPEIRIEIQGKTIQIPSNDKGIAPIGAAWKAELGISLSSLP